MFDAPCSQQRAEMRRKAANSRAIALGFRDRDLAMLYHTIARLLGAAWADACDDDPALDGLDLDAIRHDIAAFCGGHPGPGLETGLAELARLVPSQGPDLMIRIGQLVELHADYTILTPVFMTHEAWVERLRRAGRTIRREAERFGCDAGWPRAAAEAELAFLSRVFLSLSS